MTETREARLFECELRAEQNEEHGHYIVGRPIVFGQRTNIGPFDEIIDRGALDLTDLKDVRLLVGHNDQGIPVARSRNNNEHSTMQLMPNAEGMDMRADLDIENNAEARALYSVTARGDMTGMSFAFIVDRDSWDDIDSDHPVRHIRSIRKVFEVSAVAFPAYEQTSMEARSAGGALDSALASLESARAELNEQREAQRLAERRQAALARLKGGKINE